MSGLLTLVVLSIVCVGLVVVGGAVALALYWINQDFDRSDRH